MKLYSWCFAKDDDGMFIFQEVEVIEGVQALLKRSIEQATEQTRY